MNDFDTISNEQLGNVTGGGLKGKAAGWLGGKVQGAYKWWTGSNKAGTPKQIHDELGNIGGTVGKVGAGAAAGYSLGKSSGGTTQSQPSDR